MAAAVLLCRRSRPGLLLQPPAEPLGSSAPANAIRRSVRGGNALALAQEPQHAASPMSALQQATLALLDSILDQLAVHRAPADPASAPVLAFPAGPRAAATPSAVARLTSASQFTYCSDGACPAQVSSSLRRRRRRRRRHRCLAACCVCALCLPDCSIPKADLLSTPLQADQPCGLPPGCWRRCCS